MGLLVTAETNKQAIGTWQPQPKKHYRHILWYGQSLSVGAMSGPVVSTWQPGLNRTFINGPIAFDDPDDFTDTQWLYEILEETCASGHSAYTVEQDRYRYLFESAAGRSGWLISWLSKGQPWYEQMMKPQLVNAPSLVTGEGNDYSLDAIMFLHGYSDQVTYSTEREFYKTKLKQLRVDMEADSHALTGNSNTVPMYIYHMSCGLSTNQRDVTLAQWDAYHEDDNIFMVTPTFPFPRTDFAHLTATGYRWMGYYFGRAHYQTSVLNQPWRPLEPEYISGQGNKVDIQFHVPEPPLVWDTSQVPETTDLGFAVEDDGGQKTISDIETIGAYIVRLTLSETLDTNPRVRCGMDYCSTDLGAGDGGGTHNLRDSSADVMALGQDVYHMYNWAVHFDEPISV